MENKHEGVRGGVRLEKFCLFLESFIDLVCKLYKDISRTLLCSSHGKVCFNESIVYGCREDMVALARTEPVKDVACTRNIIQVMQAGIHDREQVLSGGVGVVEVISSRRTITGQRRRKNSV